MFFKLFVLCYLVFLALLYVFQRRLLYFPSKSRPSLESFKDIYKEIQTQTKEGFSLTHWYSKRGSPYIIVFHGNAGNIEDRASIYKFLADQKYSVLLASYRGYGTNSGTPTEKHLVEDSSFVLEWLLKEENILSKEIILFGESLGSGVAVAFSYPLSSESSHF